MWTRVAAAAGCFAAIIGFSRLAYGVLVPGMRATLGGDFATYGAIGAANLAGYFIGSLFAVRLGGRRDRIRINLVALGAMCLAMAASGAVATTWQLGVLRFAVGLASGVALAIVLSLGVENVPPAKRGLAASLVWAGGGAGMAIASLAAGHGVLADWRTSWLAMGIAGGLATVTFAFAVRDAAERNKLADDGASIGLWSLRGYLPLALGYLGYGFAYVDVVTFFPVALARSHAAPAGATGAILGIAAIAASLIWGPLVDRYRNGFPVALAALGCAFGTVGMASPNGTLALAGALAFGLSFIGVPAMVGALAQQREPAHRYARAFASLTLFLGIAQIAGPYAGGILSDHFGANAALVAGALAFAACALLVVCYRAPQPEAVAERDAPREQPAAQPVRTLAVRLQ